MNILYYLSGFDGCGLFRLQQPAKYLNRIPNVHARISTQYETEDLDWADLVVLQKQVDPRALPYVQYAKGRGKKIIAECDDCYFSLPSWNPAHAYYKDKGPQLIEFYKLADALTVTTPHLRQQLLKYNPNIYVLPNSIDLEVQESLEGMEDSVLNKYTSYLDLSRKELSLSEARARMQGRLLYGWGGSPTHLRDLDQATEALKQFCSEKKEVLLVMMACCTETLLKCIPPEQLLLVKPVPIFRYHQVLTSMKWAAGICPIEENVFNRSKSNLKFLEFTVNGYACVCSNVENYAKTVLEGQTGLLANNTKESWYKALLKLTDDSKRKEISENGKKFVTENYDMSKNVNLWLESYQEVLSK